MKMKIIHTSDWHLGHRLYNYDRSDEEQRFFGQLADIAGKERPDALVVAGDVFHTSAPGNDVAKSFTDRLMEVVERCPGMETVVIAGNHDSYSRLVVDAALWKRCRVHVFGMPAEDEEGDAVLDANIVEIAGKGFVAAVPFCHARNFPKVPDRFGVDRGKAYFAALSARLAELNAGKGLPQVLVAHLAAGKDTSFAGQDRLGVIGGEECVDPESLGSGYDYIALGHIHCPQRVKGTGNTMVRYCGTPRAIHFDETYPHGVDVVEIAPGAEPAVRTVEFEPLRGLKTFGGAAGKPFGEALADLAASDAGRGTYVRLNVSIGQGELPGADWSERARKTASEKGLRFCHVNPIRDGAAEEKAGERIALTVDELKDLSADRVVGILARRHPLTERQKALIGRLLEDPGK